jgi:phenylalanyl-tRNA synthetase beta chain
MNISYRWLRALAPDITDGPTELAHRLAMLGAPVDEVVDLGAGIEGVVVARVVEVRQHPNADRLRLCTVDAGSGERVQVVCGAPNVEAGRYYPFAPIGASLPGGFEIRRAKLRGETSEGMLCSSRELGLGRDHEGLMTLHGEWEPGASFVEALSIQDARLLVDVTANRPDLLSHVGIAREVAPGGAAGVRLPPIPGGGTEAEVELRATGASGEAAGVRITINDADACPRYLGAVVRGVRVGPSPEWLASRLRGAGLRPINNVVDATNYVLHELGQPLHAFDLARLGSEVRIRRATAGERMRTLDGTDRELSDDMLVIADGARPVAVAGVMGGEDSEVTEATTDVFLECALFEARRVRRTARALGLSTDASYRFERGVDPALQPLAMRRLIEVVIAVAGGTVDGAIADLHPAPPAPVVVELRPDRVERLLGIPLSAERIAAALREIGFEAEGTETSLRVTVPGWRPDVTREIDLIEEVARRVGYDEFPEQFLPFRPSAVPQDARVAVEAGLRERFRGWGFLESRTVGFAPAAEHRVPLLNPLSAEESHLRDSLVPGLLRRVEHNWARGTRDVRLFEIGTVFLPDGADGRPREEVRAAAVMTGRREPAHWTGTGADGSWDAWDLKEIAARLVDELGGGEVVPGDSPWALPVDGATELTMRGAVAGGAGRAGAGALDAPAWAEDVWTLEVRLPDAAPAAERTYRPIPEHPPIDRDLALITPSAVTAAEVAEVIRAQGGPLLERAEPFDVYRGAGIPDGATSVAWSLRFRAADRTLADSEVDRVVAAILGALEERLGVRRR